MSCMFSKIIDIWAQILILLKVELTQRHVSMEEQSMSLLLICGMGLVCKNEAPENF